MSIIDDLTRPLHPELPRFELDAHALCGPGLAGALGASGSTAREELHRALARFDKRISWLLAAAGEDSTVNIDELPGDVALDWIVEPVRIFREHAKGRGWSEAVIRENANTGRRVLAGSAMTRFREKYEQLAVTLFGAYLLDDRGNVNVAQTRIYTERAIHHATAAFLLHLQGDPEFTFGDNPTATSYQVQQTRFDAALRRFTPRLVGNVMSSAWTATREEHWGTDEYGEYFKHTPEESEIIRAQALVRLMEAGAALTGSSNEPTLRTYFAALALSMRHAAQTERQLADAEALFALGSMAGLMQAYEQVRAKLEARRAEEEARQQEIRDAAAARRADLIRGAREGGSTSGGSTSGSSSRAVVLQMLAAQLAGLVADGSMPAESLDTWDAVAARLADRDLMGAFQRFVQSGGDPAAALPASASFGSLSMAGLPWYAWLALAGVAVTALRPR